MFLEIVTPDKKVFEGEIQLIQLPGTNGSFELMKNHAPIISSLSEGNIKVQTNEKDIFFNIAGGVIECVNNKIVVLVEMTNN